MSSDALTPQVALTDRDRGDSTAVGDDVVISVRNVGKMYYLYDRPQDRLKQAFLWGRKKLYREFWALRDISFEVKRGETVGIIGQNGSGKSTLLQIVSGTLTPTTGEVRVNGRVAALLELGSGFNFEFTGRENVYMNGAILGLSRAEMDARFDEIVAFADIGQFIDQPLKTYSSGMVVRLAFACAINVDPDILIVDEVLAVGDIMFQSRCFERIQRMMESGVTTLLVTHDLNAFQMLCTYGYMLDGGTIYTQGKPKQVGLQYYEMMREREHTRQTLAQASDYEQRRQAKERLQSKHAEIRERTDEDEYRWGTGTARITDFKIFDHEGHETESLESGRPFKIWIQVEFHGDVANPVFSVMFRNVMNQNLFGMHTYLMDRIDFGPQHQGDILCVEFENNMWLNPSEYLLQIGVGDFRTEYDYDSLDVLNRAAKIDVYGPKLSYGVVHSTARIRTVSPDAPPDPISRPHYVILDDPGPDTTQGKPTQHLYDVSVLDYSLDQVKNTYEAVLDNPELQGVLQTILQYNDTNVDKRVVPEGEERAWPGTPRFIESGYYRTMLGRYAFAGSHFCRYANVLETCCGLGWGAFLISQYARQVTAFDNAPNVVDFCSATWPANNIRWLTGDGRNLSFLDEQPYDVALGMEAIEHFSQSDGATYVKEIARVLRPGGVFVGTSVFPETEQEARDTQSTNQYHLHICTRTEMLALLGQYFNKAAIIGNWIFVAIK